LDKVQKKLPLDDASFLRLKSQKLIDGRRPNIFVSAKVAAVTGDKATYIKNRAFNKSYYQAMIVSYLEKYGTATRKDFDDLLLNKLSDTLNIRQKHHFLKNLLQDLRRESILTTDGGTRGTKWRLSKTNSETPG
jgi:ATP-dependent DNA helicase RecG